MDLGRPSPPRRFSGWDLLPLGTALALALILPARMRHLPDLVPTHFSAMGRPDGWTPKSLLPWILFGIPAAMWILLLATGRAFAGTAQDPDGRKSAALAPLRGLSTAGALGALAMATLVPNGLWPGLIGLLGLLFLGLVLLVRGLKRLGTDERSPALYRWGLFYVNPGDPRIWVPKRFGLGWTLNYAHGAAWWITALLLSPALLLILVSRGR